MSDTEARKNIETHKSQAKRLLHSQFGFSPDMESMAINKAVDHIVAAAVMESLLSTKIVVLEILRELNDELA